MALGTEQRTGLSPPDQAHTLTRQPSQPRRHGAPACPPDAAGRRALPARPPRHTRPPERYPRGASPAHTATPAPHKPDTTPHPKQPRYSLKSQ